jgi:mono/diheme cytochrome c family protein
MLAVGRRLPSFIIIGALIDQDKSGAKLFATNCTDCHRSPRGLAKDRFSWTLSSFLQQHYTSSPTSAHALTAYLQSVDAPRAKPQPAARTSLPPGTSGSAAPLRPPAPVPAR